MNVVPDGYWQAGELARLIDVLPPDHHADVLTIVAGIREPYFRDILRRSVAAHGGPAAPPAEVVPGASFMPDDPAVFAAQYQGRVMHGVAVLMAGDPAKVTEPRWRAELLAAAARAAAPLERAELLSAALTASLAIGDRDALVGALNAIAAGLAQAGDMDGATATLAGLTDRSADVVVSSERRQDEIDVPTWRVQALAAGGDPDAAFDLVDRTTDSTTRITLLLRIAELPPGGGRDAVAEAQKSLTQIADAELRRRLVPPLALVLADAGRRADALELVSGLVAEQDRADALVVVAPLLHGFDLETALLIARGVRSTVRRGAMLAALIPALVGSGADADVVHAQLRDALHLLAGGTRGELVSAMPALVPGLVRVAGPAGLLDLAATLAAVYRWWP